ncbi:response regulator [Luteimonas terricola]|uniref:Transcriptional regulator n=1 Tax=Luteimonas terricola TaxID=645597 RepID=A0ABQ2E9I6_9GAMM|nr:response regulator [Luteimonas terricola]GGK02326.1 transcriptional regulator [Luteimonas terricola]
MKPRILLVEDDHTTAAFLAAAAEALPACVDTVGSRAAACVQAANIAYSLWLIDAHLPDGDGTGLLAELRGLGLSTPAIAHTAAREDALHQALHDAGFDAVLVKPLTAAALRAALAGALAGRRSSRVAEPPPGSAGGPGPAPQAWDDAAALRALNGERAHVDALRQLFLAELPAARALVVSSAGRGDQDVLRDVLHRLRASCGFVGAARLGQAVIALQDAPASAEALAWFDAAAQELSPPS